LVFPEFFYIIEKESLLTDNDYKNIMLEHNLPCNEEFPKDCFLNKNYIKNSFKVNEGKYEIDSAVVRDTTKQHFCATITCEGHEMGYDGLSFHRLVPMKWKDYLNSNINWQFEGTKDYDGSPLEWNFTKSYQLLMYYRVK
jgi:hypothetical protein